MMQIQRNEFGVIGKFHIGFGRIRKGMDWNLFERFKLQTQIQKYRL